MKVVVFGSHRSGKTTFVASLGPIDHPTGMISGGEKTTVSYDLCIKEHDGYRLYIYGTPGLDRFEFARKTIAYGLHIGVILVDSTRCMTDFERETFTALKSNNVPCIVLANKADQPGASLDNIRNATGGHVQVLSISAKTGYGKDSALNAILEMAKKLE